MGVIDTTANIALCNEALGLIGAAPIAVSGTDQNHDYCELFFENDRDEILSAHKWNFAKKRAYAVQTTDPLFGYDYAYAKPTDCVRLWSIDGDPAAEYEVEGSLILTDHGEAAPDWATGTAYIAGQYVSSADVTYLCATSHTAGTFADDLAAAKWTTTSGDYKVLAVEYVYQHTTVASWPKFARRCFVIKLAISLSAPIKQNEEAAANLQAMLYGGQRTIGYLSLAKSFDAQESGGQKIHSNFFLNSRL